MTGDELRNACLALEGAAETFPFTPATSVFKSAGGKIFGIAALDAEPLELSVKCDPDRADSLRAEFEAIRPGYHLDKRHWITITIGGDAPDELALELLEDSFELVAR